MLHQGVMYYQSFDEARMTRHVLAYKDFPEARIVEFDLGYAVQYRKSGGYFPQDATTFDRHGVWNLKEILDAA